MMNSKEIFLASMERCLKEDRFVPSFYDRFISSSEEIREKFVFTDFEVQNQMLGRSLKLVAQATSGDSEGLKKLSARSETHDRHHLNIKPEHYALRKSAIMATAQEFDKQWSEEIESSWSAILEYAIKFMLRHY